MKKTFITKILILCLCFLMLFSGATVFASAAEDENSSIEWSMDKNAEYLYGNGKRYDRYYANGEFYGDARKAYYFKNKVSVNGTMCEVYGDSPDPHIVSVRYTDGYSYVFTDGEGRRILENFQNGKEVIYYLEQANYKYTVIDSSLADSLDTAYNLDDSATTMTVAVNTLTDASIYELTAHDNLEMKAYQNGAIYCMPDGTIFYVCFKYLDNSYFDADGYFSYRKGYVKALVLDSDLKNEVENALRYMETKYTSIFNRKTSINIPLKKPHLFHSGYSTLFLAFFFPYLC